MNKLLLLFAGGITLFVGSIILWVEHSVVWEFAKVAWNTITATGGQTAPLFLAILVIIVILFSIAGVIRLITSVSQ